MEANRIDDPLDIMTNTPVTYQNKRYTLMIAPIREDSQELLSRFSFPERYLPLIENMIESRKREWLTIRVLLKELLGEEKEIVYNAHGKPYLADKSYHISISHTKGYAALLLNKGKNVAVDIERISTRAEKLRSRFINDEEEVSLSPICPVIHILLHWSAKEAIFKLMLENSIDFKSQLHIRPFRPVVGEWSSFQAYETRTAKKRVFTIHYFVSKEYVLTYV